MQLQSQPAPAMNPPYPFNSLHSGRPGDTDHKERITEPRFPERRLGAFLLPRGEGMKEPPVPSAGGPTQNPRSHRQARVPGRAFGRGGPRRLVLSALTDGSRCSPRSSLSLPLSRSSRIIGRWLSSERGAFRLASVLCGGPHGSHASAESSGTDRADGWRSWL